MLIAIGPPNFSTVLGQCVRVFRRHASNWERQNAKQEELKKTVFQYAGRNPQRADRIYAWGCSATGALGLKTLLKPESHQRARLKQLTPLRIDSFRQHELKVKEVSSGYGFTVFLCLTKDGKSVAYGTGLNTDSQLGYQEFPRKSGRILDYVIEPASIALPLLHPDSTKLTHVACGRAHMVIVTDNEGVFTLGNNAYGQCGRPIVEKENHRGSETIGRLQFRQNIKQLESLVSNRGMEVHTMFRTGTIIDKSSVVCGQDHTLFLMEDGQVYSCGLGADGQTGLGCYENSVKPRRVAGDIAGEKIVYISSKADTVLAVSKEGNLFGWGNAEYDQLSEPIAMQVSTPRHLPFSGVGKVVQTAAAGSMCALLNEKGEVFTWGYGILGKGPNVEGSITPLQLPSTLFGASEFNPLIKVKHICSGLYHFAALNDSGDMFVWGKNRNACLGLGHVLDQYFPYKVQVSAEVTDVACGVDHMVVLSKSYV